MLSSECGTKKAQDFTKAAQMDVVNSVFEDEDITPESVGAIIASHMQQIVDQQARSEVPLPKCLELGFTSDFKLKHAADNSQLPL